MVHVVEFSPYWYELSLLYFLNGEYIKGAIAFRHGFTTKSVMTPTY
ncbi:shiA domain protein [Escherichia coli 2-210-07_S4_C2]|nr:shiA domain protein [Escherichia coli 2-156-04_S4_C3]KDX62110.1 shiA domain protein [Escherichia coli 2-210-07_S4_C2]KDX71184.1 shiA domain protein [Escherichia coli 2-210-07_S4_C3]KEM93496.1 shiA domain protein [Escherichia coli 2-222-05_S4_C1]